MEYPVMVYRCPGANFGPNGTTYDSLGVDDEEQLRASLINGWEKSLIEAVSNYLDAGKRDESVVDVMPGVDAGHAEEGNEADQGDANSPPTREELEQKANELGIKFDGRTTERKLLEKIEEALRGE